jgi:hypothetical protein
MSRVTTYSPSTLFLSVGHVRGEEATATTTATTTTTPFGRVKTLSTIDTLTSARREMKLIINFDLQNFESI